MSEINLYNMDCMEGLKNTSDKYYDLAIVDPPYGVGYTEVKHPDRPTKKWSNPNSIAYKDFNDINPPTQEYFNELFRTSKNQIIWGANNFEGLPVSGGWIVWDKKVDPKERLSMAELAWSSFNKKVMIFRYLWAGFKKQEQVKRIHPTQKPIALYKWLLTKYAKEGDKILDTHGGSMSIAIACHDLGFDLDLYEIDKDYFESGKKRFEKHKQQLKLAI